MPRINPETYIKRAVRDYLEWHKWFVVHIQQGAFSHKGISDLIAIKDGKVVFIEIKTKDGRQSIYQQEFAKKVIDKGGIYIVARSVEDIKNI